MKKMIVFLYASLLCLVISTAAYATLFDRGDGLIYDSDQDITWLQDADYATTWVTDAWIDTQVGTVIEGHTIAAADFFYQGPGAMNWWAATAFVRGLDYGGYTNWRLPTTPGTIYDKTNEGEMGHIYWDDSTTYYTPGLFSNIIGSLYWTGTNLANNPEHYAWRYTMFRGTQSDLMKSSFCYAWAIHDGDIGGSGSEPIPEPATMLLLGTGLAGLGLCRKKKGKKKEV